MFLAHRLFGFFRLQIGFCISTATPFLLLFVDIDDILNQQVTLEPVNSMAVKYNFKSASWTSEHATRKAVWIAWIIQVTGTAAAQVVLAGQNDHRFGEHIQADGAAQLLLQAVHGAGRPHNRSCSLEVHNQSLYCLSLNGRFVNLPKVKTLCLLKLKWALKIDCWAEGWSFSEG